MKRLQILIKPASGACNIDCRYCFYKAEAKTREHKDLRNMSRETMRLLVERALGATDSCLFGFQGGEPTLAGLEFYQDFTAYVEEKRRPGQEVLYTIQTNGIGLDEAWMEFLKTHGFLVGISLDGVRRSHDENRIDYEGNGTFSRVFETVERLKDWGIPFQILCVLNAQTAPRIGAIYRFFLRKGLYGQQYIPCMEPEGEGRRQPNSLEPEGEGRRRSYSLEPRELAQAMKTLFDLWFEDRLRGIPVSIRQFDNYVEMLAGGEPEACTMYGKCSMQNVVEADGTVYPCDFYAMDGFELGNLRDLDFEALAELDEGAGENPFFHEMTKRDDRCGACRWYPLCRGGCKRDCRKESGSWKNRYCEAYQEFFSYTIERLEYLAARIR